MKVDTTNIIEQAVVKQPVSNQHPEPKQVASQLNKPITFEDHSTSLAKAEDEMNQDVEKDSEAVNMEEVAQKLQDFVDSLNTSLRFSVDKESGRDIIKVVDSASGDLIRQFPSEEVLDVIKSLSKATGILLSEKV